MGKGLESIVRMSSTPAEAIDDVLRKYPALKEMADWHVWFHPPLLETIARRCIVRCATRAEASIGGWCGI
jgi:hypothetical protein